MFVFLRLRLGLLIVFLGDNNTKFNVDRDAVAKVAQQCNMYVSRARFSLHLHPDPVYSKRDSAVLAQEQSAHLFLCVLISDLTSRYGPVIRQAKVIGVLDAAFDVIIPEFGIEKRVHVDQMPIDVWFSQIFPAPHRLRLCRIMFTTNIRMRFRSTGPIVTLFHGLRNTPTMSTLRR